MEIISKCCMIGSIYCSFCDFFYWFFVCFVFAFVFSLSSFIMFFCLVCYIFFICLTLFHFLFYWKVFLYRPLYFISVFCLFVWFFVSQLFFLYVFYVYFFCCSWIFILISAFDFFGKYILKKHIFFSCGSLLAPEESFDVTWYARDIMPQWRLCRALKQWHGRKVITK